MTKPATASAVLRWFGAGFAQLHPQLQALHNQNSRLTGSVQFQFGQGLAGVIGRRLARRLGLPSADGSHELTVEIHHDENHMVWHRHIAPAHELCSVFQPIGRWPDGCWRERTGAVAMDLQVDIQDGGWRWRTIRTQLFGLPVPSWLLPRVTAYKRMEDGRYRFYVGFAFPGLGLLFSYSGLLTASAG